MDRTPVDTLVDARWVVPVEPAHTTLPHHSIAIRAGCIEAVLPTAEAHARFTPARHVMLKEHVLIPGLVNLHTHAPMTLLRGLADDLPLMTWLQEHIWPAEGRHVSPDFVRDGTLLACAEMLRGGITCFNDMYFFPRATAEAAIAAHMRAVAGLITIEFPTGYASDADDYLNKGLAVRDDYRHEDLVSFAMAPHAPYTVSDRTFERVVTYAEQLNVPIHVHIHETQDEIRQGMEQHGLRPLARLEKLGLLGPNLIAVHTVHLTPEEIAILARQGCHAAHCPSSNLKLASGIAPVAQMLDAGVNVGLGTDGSASNNRLDLFEEMRLAALLAKGASGRADVLPAHRTLAMATLGGARALGLDSRIGSLVPGKAADITAVDISALETLPCYDPVSHLVYVAGREQVSHVWVGGRPVLEERRLTTLDSRDLATRALRWQDTVARSDAEKQKH